ncbi:MAG: flavin reductase [archaeon]
MDRNLALSIIGPRQAVLVTCQGKMAVGSATRQATDIHPVTSHMLVSAEPFVYAIALDKDVGATEIIRHTGVFAINFVPARFARIVDRLMNHPLKEDKVEISGLDIKPCEKIDGFRLADVAGYLECEVMDRFDYGDREMIIGRVVAGAESEKHDRLSHDIEHGFGRMRHDG